jgi:hypothetical protein
MEDEMRDYQIRQAADEACISYTNLQEGRNEACSKGAGGEGISAVECSKVSSVFIEYRALSGAKRCFSCSALFLCFWGCQVNCVTGVSS